MEKLSLITLIALFLAYLFQLLFPKTDFKKLTKNFFPSPTPTLMKTKYLFASSSAQVIKVIDGDTIEVGNNKKIRYIGIDTPETKHPKKEIQCFGQEAYLKNRELVEGKRIIMKKDVSETDKYGRLLRYVWLVDEKNASASGLFINDYLVRQGYAYAATFPPDVAYAQQFREAQQEAQENNRGLWQSCP